jgi:hypothetical protein
MTTIEKLNTITRTLLYFIILILLFNKDKIFVVYALLFILLILVFYFIYNSDSNSIKSDLLKTNKEIEEYTKDNYYCPSNGCKINCKDDCNENSDSNKNSGSNEPINSIYNDPNYRDLILKDGSSRNVSLEAGYIDSDGNYRLGKEYTLQSNNNNNNNNKLSYELNEEYKKNNCRKPTADNPFMNIVFSDYLDASNIPEPCNSNKIQDTSKFLYNSTIYRNIEDVFERENSQRLFYTLPITTIPNKQKDFADWLYKTGPQCKENSSNCTYFEEPYMVSQRY